MTETELVSIERRGRVAIAVLNRPDKRNAVNPALAEALDAALNELDDDRTVRAIVLAATGVAFSSGTDLVEGSGNPSPRGGEYGIIRRYRTTPMIAAIEGAALGGGLEIALTCDLIVASKSATFGLPEVGRGVVATSGALFRAAKVMPRNVVREMLLTGRPITAERAFECGLVNEVTAPGHAIEAAVAVAQVIASNAPASIAITLEAIEAFSRRSDDEGWAISDRAKQRSLLSADIEEGIAAFKERRPPVWSDPA